MGCSLLWDEVLTLVEGWDAPCCVWAQPSRVLLVVGWIAHPSRWGWDVLLVVGWIAHPSRGVGCSLLWDEVLTLVDGCSAPCCGMRVLTLVEGWGAPCCGMECSP